MDIYKTYDIVMKENLFRKEIEIDVLSQEVSNDFKQGIAFVSQATILRTRRS